MLLLGLLLAINWIGFVKSVLMFFFVLSAALLLLVVLLQEPKGGGLSSAFGGAGAESFGVQTGGVNKFTTWVAGVFMFIAILYAAIRPPEAGAPSDEFRRGGDDTEAPPGVTAPPEDTGRTDGNKSSGSGNTDEKKKDE